MPDIIPNLGQISGQTKRANANDLKLAEVADLEISEPKSKKTRMRKATFVELEYMETEEDSEEDEDTDKKVLVLWRDPPLMASDVHSSSVSLLSRGVTALPPSPHKSGRKTRSPSKKAQASKLNSPKQKRGLSE